MRESTATAILVVLLGCTPHAPEKWVDGDELPPDYLGKSYRAWVREGQLVVEVDQIAGLNVARIDCEVRDGTVYLRPGRVSSGGAHRMLIPVECGRPISPDLASRLYWIAVEYFYPIESPAASQPKQRSPSVRVRVHLEQAPQQGAATDKAAL